MSFIESVSVILEEGSTVESKVFFFFPEVLFGFLAYQYPYYFALSMSAGLELYFNTVDVLMELARTVHQLVSLLSPSTVAQLEKEELLWDKTGKGWRVCDSLMGLGIASE